MCRYWRKLALAAIGKVRIDKAYELNMKTIFPLIQVKNSIGDEPLGTKTKFWFLHDERHWLYKEARTDTGEDWAEKIAAELEIGRASCRERV